MKKGEKVICVKKFEENINYNLTVLYFPKIDEIFTIRGFSYLGGLLFEEVLAGFYWVGGKEAGYGIHHFRRLSDHKLTNHKLSSEFTKKLANKPLVKEVIEQPKKQKNGIKD